MIAHEEINPYLDRLYNSTVRCPYCRARIKKYTTTCIRCGVHKRQIFDSSNLEAKKVMKEKSGAKIFKTRRRPEDVSFTRMSMLVFFLGLFGQHCFHVGRKIRGWFFVASTIIGFTTVFVPPAWMDYFSNIDEILLFPTAYFIIASLVLWGYDIVAIVFGFFKYPIRLGEKPIEKSNVSGKDILKANLKTKPGKKAG